MTRRHLKIFVTVCEENSFTKAADKLAMTQPAVSAAIRELELYYEVRLFDRMNRRIFLTEQGEELLPCARRILQQFDEAEWNVRQRNGHTTLRVGCNISYGCSIFPGLLADFQEAYPNVQVFSHIANSQSIEQKLLDNEIDFAIVDNLTVSPSFHCRKILSENMLMVCGEGYRRNLPDGLDLEGLRDQKFLLREKGSGARDSVDELFESVGLTPRVVMESASTLALINGAVHNLGIGVVPESIAESYLRNGQLCLVEAEGVSFLRNYFLISHRSRQMSTGMQCFMELLMGEKSREG